MEEKKMSDEKSVEIYTEAEYKKKVAPLCDLIEKMSKEDPDPKKLALLRRAMREHPVLWDIAGDLAKAAREEIITNLTKSAYTRESVRAYVKHVRNELGRESAPMLEKLLMDQVVICWLRLYDIEIIYSQIRSSGPVTLDVGAYYEHRLSAAQRRFLRACTTLSRIRKMAGRTPELMQLNIGAQQVNVAQVSED